MFSLKLVLVSFVLLHTSHSSKYVKLKQNKDCGKEIHQSEASGVNYLFQKHGRNNTLDHLGLYYLMNNITYTGHSESEETEFDHYLNCTIFKILSDSGVSIDKITASDFSTICPTLLEVLDNSYERKLLENESENLTPSRSSIWGFGIISVTIISLCSLVGISVLPLMKKDIYDKILLYLISLAVGTLSSNAIFQLIPEGFGIEEDPMTVWRSAIIFGGFYLFYLTDHILERIFKVSHEHEGIQDLEDNMVTGESFLKGSDKSIVKKSFPVGGEQKTGSGDSLYASTSHESGSTLLGMPKVVDNQQFDNYQVDIQCEVGSVPNRQCWAFKNYKSIKTVAWMITIADGIHNFIDGLAIGASFSVSLLQGVSTSIAIFCEEFPHELGDFAVLLNSGMNIRQAAFYNFASACCCYLGLIVGILIGNDMSSARWIFALAGGVFLYISLAGMLPEAKAHSHNKKLRDRPWLCLILQHAGLLTGFTIMFLLTYFKDLLSLSSS